MQEPEMQKQLADKNVVVFRGKTKDAIDMQLCKMDIVPCAIDARDSLSEIKTDINKKFVNGLASISENIGRPGLEKIMYKLVPGLGESEWYKNNNKEEAKVKAESLKDFFEFFFEQNPSVSKQKGKLLDVAKQSINSSLENDIYTKINGEGTQKEIVNEIMDMLGEDRVNETINVYNEKVLLAFEQRRADFIAGLHGIRKDEKAKAKTEFDEGTLNSDLQELFIETTMSGFNEMSQNVKQAQKLNEQEQMVDGVKIDKRGEGWDVDDD